jgi:hypothetical protein
MFLPSFSSFCSFFNAKFSQHYRLENYETPHGSQTGFEPSTSQMQVGCVNAVPFGPAF